MNNASSAWEELGRTMHSPYLRSSMVNSSDPYATSLARCESQEFGLGQLQNAPLLTILERASKPLEMLRGISPIVLVSGAPCRAEDDSALNDLDVELGLAGDSQCAPGRFRNGYPSRRAHQDLGHRRHFADLYPYFSIQASALPQKCANLTTKPGGDSPGNRPV